MKSKSSLELLLRFTY